MTQALWTADEVAAATNGKAARGFAATGVSIDSRSVERGDLFVALQGPTFDGHDFVAGALARGAAGALIHRRPKDLPADAPVIEVADTMRGLEDLGRAARARTEARVAAVTGSVGKTSTARSSAPPMPAPATSTTSGGRRSASPACRATAATACSNSA